MFAVAFLLVVVAATTWWFWFKVQARKKAVIPHNSDVIIQDLYVYPVKSCKGFRVDKWPVCETGFLYDRKWMVVENGTFNFVTQRQDARMALIQPTLDDNQLRLSAPGMESITVCSLPPDTKEWMVDNQGAIRDKIYVTVWESKVTAIDMGEEVSAWLSKYLGKDVRLAMYPLKSDEHDLRDIPEKWSQDVDKLQEDRKGTENWHKSPAFADEYPFLAISQESLDHFKKQIGREIFMNRFRPNIVVKGCAYPHEEDEWMECASGNDGAIKLFGCKPCQRCPVTCVVQEKGISESESTEGTVDDPAKCTKIESVLQALGKYRKSPNFAFGPLFGQNLVHALPDQGSQQESSSTSEVRAALNLQEILAENGEKHGIYCLHTGNTLQVRSWRDENYVDQFLQLNTQ